MTSYILDTSVIARLNQPAVRDRIRSLGRQNMYITTITLLEIGYTARNRDHRIKLLESLTLAYRVAHLSPWAQDRALEYQFALTERGLHRTARMPDLLIAAAAEQLGATVLHYDQDFDNLSREAGVLCDWIAPAGTLDQPRAVLREGDG